MSGERATTGAVSSGGGPNSGERRYLLAVDGESTNSLLPIVCDLVADVQGELVIGNPVILPGQTPLSMPDPRHDGERLVAEIALKVQQECQGPPPIHQAVEIGRSRGRILNHFVDRYDVSTVVTEDQPASGLRSILGLDGVDEVSLTSGCDTVIVSRTNRTNAIDSVLVAVARGPHSGMAIDVGGALARQNEASLELLHVFDSDDAGAKEAGESVLDHSMARVDDYGSVETTLLDADDVPEVIVEYTDGFDVTVLGAPRDGLIRQFVLGTIPDSVSARTDGTVIVAHRGDADESWLDRWL